MEVVGRQRSSSDPPNPHIPERNSSMNGKCTTLYYQIVLAPDLSLTCDYTALLAQQQDISTV